MEQTPSTPQPTDRQPPPPPPQPSPSSLLPPSSSLPSTSSFSSIIPSSSPNPNPNSNPNLPISQNSQTRPPFNRPWQQQQPSHIPHFSSHPQSMPPPFSSSSSSSITAQRGGMAAVGVPVHKPSPPSPRTSFSSLNPPPSIGQQFGELARNAASVSESVTSPSTSLVRQPTQGIQGMGTMGSFGSGPPMRPGGISTHPQQRPVQSSVRPQTTTNSPSSTSQNFQGHGMLRVPAVGSPVSPSSMSPHNQPWLSSGSQGKPPFPSPPFRPQMNSQSLQQRSHVPQQHRHPMSTASQQLQTSSSQQSSPLHPLQEHYGQQFPPSRVAQSLPHQQQIPRGPGLGDQKPSSNTVVQPTIVSSAPPNKTASPEIVESCNRILSKRSIQELVSQIDPSERLDPGVEDILVDIADEFVESITTFGCSLAKHRKSTTLEAKDILLHLERNWNVTLPGYSGDEIKSYRKPFASDIHRERLAVIKKSVATADIANTKSSAGQAAGNAKGYLAKAPANVIGSPNPPKI